MADELKTEIATYQKELPSLLPHEGKYVLIHGDKVLDIFESYPDALKAGYKHCGLKPFMVRKIQATEAVQFLSRDLCQT